MTTLLEDARADLVAALQAVPGARVYPYQPAQPAAPMVWLGPFNLRPTSLDNIVTAVMAAEATVFAAVDGAASSQVAQLDVLTAHIVQALDAICTVTGAVVGPIDVGGPRLYGLTVSCDLVLTIRSLCPQALVNDELEMETT